MPGEQTAAVGSGGGGSVGSSGGGGGEAQQRSIPTPFLTKTYQIVDDSSVDDLISWNEDGTTFIVWRPPEFARDLLPKYFKHNNFSSFVRQLNTYGFRKVVPDRWEFAHDFFRRGEKGLLRDIQRRKISPAAAVAAAAAASGVTVAAVPFVGRASISPSNSGDEQVISTNSSPAGVPLGVPTQQPPPPSSRSSTAGPELMVENERLRRENMQLSHELTHLKGLCNNILAMMTNYASAQLENANYSPLDMIPAPEAVVEDHDDLTPRLFGVSLGVKRARRDEAEEAEDEEEEEVDERGRSEIKAEPLVEDGSDHRNGPWLELGK